MKENTPNGRKIEKCNPKRQRGGVTQYAASLTLRVTMTATAQLQRLKYAPGLEGDKYTCTEYTYRKDDGPEQSIPALAGWTYVFKLVPR